MSRTDKLQAKKKKRGGGFGVIIPARILNYSGSVLAQSPAVFTVCFVVFLSFVMKILEE